MASASWSGRDSSPPVDRARSHPWSNRSPARKPANAEPGMSPAGWWTIRSRAPSASNAASWVAAVSSKRSTGSPSKLPVRAAAMASWVLPPSRRATAKRLPPTMWSALSFTVHSPHTDCSPQRSAGTAASRTRYSTAVRLNKSRGSMSATLVRVARPTSRPHRGGRPPEGGGRSPSPARHLRPRHRQPRRVSADPSLLCAGCRDLDDGHVLVPLEAEDDDELRVAGEGADGVRALDQLLGRARGANAV